MPTKSFFAYEEVGLSGKLQVLAAVGYCVLGIAIVAMCISFIQVSLANAPIAMIQLLSFPLLLYLPSALKSFLRDCNNCMNFPYIANLFIFDTFSCMI